MNRLSKLMFLMLVFSLSIAQSASAQTVIVRKPRAVKKVRVVKRLPSRTVVVAKPVVAIAPRRRAIVTRNTVVVRR